MNSNVATNVLKSPVNDTLATNDDWDFEPAAELDDVEWVQIKW